MQKKKCFFLYNLLSPVPSHIQTNITTKGKESFPSFPWEHHTVCRAVKAKSNALRVFLCLCQIQTLWRWRWCTVLRETPPSWSVFLARPRRSSGGRCRSQTASSRLSVRHMKAERWVYCSLFSFQIKSIQVFTDVDSRVFFFSLLWLIHKKHYHDFSLWIFPLNVLLPLVLFVYIFSPEPPKDKTLTDIIFWLNLSKQKQCISERLCFCLTKIGRLKDV